MTALSWELACLDGKKSCIFQAKNARRPPARVREGEKGVQTAWPDGKQACRPPFAQCCKEMYPCASPLLPGGVQNGISNPFGKQKRKWRKQYK